MRLYLSIILLCTLSSGSLMNDSARTVHIFSGTLTNITCSAIQPGFRLMKQNMNYDTEHYSQLPDLFDIEARVSPTGSEVTLLINGTSRSDNVTVICRNFTSIVLGHIEILFRLELEFVNVLPAPSDVDYIGHGETELLQIVWRPPSLLLDEFGFQNVSIDSKITHYIVFMITEDSVVANSTSEILSFSIKLDNISCRLSFQVAAVNPAGVGEPSPLQIINWCTDSTTSSTDTEPGPVSEVNIISTGEIAAIVTCTCVAVLIAMIVLSALIYAKFKNTRSFKSELSGQMSYLKDMLPVEKEKHMEVGHSGSDNDDSVDKRQPSDSTNRGSNYSQEGPPVGLYYAEIDVITKRQNQVPEPDTSHHEYAVLEQPNQITNTDHDIDNSD